ncbi:MAG: hypothetical protein KC713_02815, partial [Candidatus Omnitrophica bacterium]|nr:hypothetical protein [Candidatus Omnitrophota bacterium]
GISGFIFLLWLFIIFISKKARAWWEFALLGLAAGVISTMQYTLLFFSPALFLTIFIFYVKERKTFWDTLWHCFVAGFTYLVSVLPMVYFFLFKQIREGKGGLYSWNKGAAEEYFFHTPHEASLFQQAGYILKFFTGNFIEILQSNLGFVPNGNEAFSGWAVIWTVLFVCGIMKFTLSGSRKTRFLGLLFLFCGVTWAALVVMHKLTFSPTRHSAVLMPMMAITVSEGVLGIRNSLEKTLLLKKHFILKMLNLWMPALLSLYVLSVFTLNYPRWMDAREDPFLEEEILRLIEDYQVGALVATNSTYQVEMMKSVRDHFQYYSKGFREDFLMTNTYRPYERMVWVSHREPLTAQTFKRAQGAINQYIFMINVERKKREAEIFPLWRYPLNTYRVLYKYVQPSDEELEYLPRTHNGTNGCYFYVMERIL